VKAFLLEGTRTAKLAVVRKDGSPFVTLVWFLLDDDGSVIFETERKSLKGHAIARDPRVSFCVEDDRPPFGFVRLDSVADFSKGDSDLLAWTTRIAARYMGHERAEEIGSVNAGEDTL
jgi:PPOX class probable F420-dependent enzyme